MVNWKASYTHSKVYAVGHHRPKVKYNKFTVTYEWIHQEVQVHLSCKELSLKWKQGATFADDTGSHLKEESRVQQKKIGLLMGYKYTYIYIYIWWVFCVNMHKNLLKATILYWEFILRRLQDNQKSIFKDAHSSFCRRTLKIQWGEGKWAVLCSLQMREATNWEWCYHIMTKFTDMAR